MKVLALETGSEWCSVAVGDGTHWVVRERPAEVNAIIREYLVQR